VPATALMLPYIRKPRLISSFESRKKYYSLSTRANKWLWLPRSAGEIPC